MKRGWEMKRLGDVCEVVSGSTPKTSVPEYWKGDNFWVTPAELGKDEVLFSTERRISDEAVRKTNLTILPVGSVILSSRAPIGKVAIAGVNMSTNQGFKNFICSSEILNRYLFWFLKSKTLYLNSLGRGATFKEISKRIVEKVLIPLPDIYIQEKVVIELDTLNDIITKKKQQLEELDKLAQATFYEMFGDPVENEKKWLMKKLGELGYFKNGINYKQLDSGYSIRCVGVGDFKKNAIIDDFEKIPKVSLTDKPSAEYMLKDGDILFVRSNGSKDLVGRNMCVMIGGNEATFSGFCIRFRLESEDVSSFFLNTLLRIESIKNMLLGQSRGCNISNLNQGMLSEQIIPVPPLSLQHIFSSRISSIESQKSLLQQSLTDTQQLFDYTMNKYFGS